MFPMGTSTTANFGVYSIQYGGRSSICALIPNAHGFFLPGIRFEGFLAGFCYHTSAISSLIRGIWNDQGLCPPFLPFLRLSLESALYSWSRMSYDRLLDFPLSNGSLAKGRGGSSGSGNSSIDDAWDADPLMKAMVVAYFVWFILALIQIGFILKRLRNVQTRASKGPFIFMIVVLLGAAVHFILQGIYWRLYDVVLSMSLDGIYYTSEFFNHFFVAFLPGVVLYLFHLRSDIASQQQQGPIFMSRNWKKAFDWAIIAILYLTFIIYFAWRVDDNRGYLNMVMTGMPWHDRSLERANSIHAVYAFQIIAYLDVLVSSIVLHVQLKKRNTPDPVVTRLMWGTPIFFLLQIVRWLFTNMFEAGTFPSGMSSILAAFVDGLAAIAIAALFIWVMTLPGVQWAPLGGTAGTDQNTPYTIQQPQNWQTGAYQMSAAPAPYNATPGWQAQPQPVMQYSSWNGSATWKPQEQPVQQQSGQPVVQYFAWNGAPGWQPQQQQQQQQAAAQFYALPLQNHSQQYVPPSHPPPSKQ